MTKIVMRADGSALSGIGHVMRTLAIAEAAAAHSLPVRYVTATPEVVPLLARRGLAATLIPASTDTAWCSDLDPGDIVVFDGYTFTDQDYEAPARQGARTVAVDDTGSGSFPVDLIVNPDQAGGHAYSALRHTRVVGGPELALVREEFAGRRRSRGGAAANLVITFGGTDAASMSTRAVEAIDAASGFDHVTLVVGPGATVNPVVSDRLEIVRDPTDMGAVLDAADAAISAAGLTAWELMCMGLPSALVAVADNQLATGRIVLQHDAALFIGSPEEFEAGIEKALPELADPDRQAALSRNAMALVDGKGAERVLGIILSLGDRAPTAPT